MNRGLQRTLLQASQNRCNHVEYKVSEIRKDDHTPYLIHGSTVTIYICTNRHVLVFVVTFENIELWTRLPDPFPHLKLAAEGPDMSVNSIRLLGLQETVQTACCASSASKT